MAQGLPNILDLRQNPTNSLSTVQNSPSLDHYTPCPKYVTDGVMLVEKFRGNMLGNVRDKSVI